MRLLAPCTVVLLGLGPAAVATVTPSRPTLEAAVRATDGAVQLSWSAADGGPAGIYQVEEAPAADFTTPILRYEGPQEASFVSGLPAGSYYYRVRQRRPDATWTPWSEPVAAHIEPHPLNLAWSLFGLGAFLVVTLVTFLVVAERRARAGASA